MSAFEEAAQARIVAAGVPLGTIVDDRVRLEPFGSAFLLRWDGALILSADEVMQLLGATPGESDQPHEPIPVQDASGTDPERKAYADYMDGRITRAEWSAVAFDHMFGPEPSDRDEL